MSPRHNIFRRIRRMILSLIIFASCLFAIILASDIKVEAAFWEENYKVSLSFDRFFYQDTIDNADGKVRIYAVATIDTYNYSYFTPINIPIHIRTRDYTAKAPEDYTAVDKIVYLTNRDGYFIYDCFTIDVNEASYSIDGEAPSLYVELVEVLAEGFSVNEPYSKVKINLATRYEITTASAFGTKMFDKYLTAAKETLKFDITTKARETIEIKDDGFSFTNSSSDLARAYYNGPYQYFSSVYVGNQAYISDGLLFLYIPSYFDIEISDYLGGSTLFSCSYKDFYSDPGRFIRFGATDYNIVYKDQYYPEIWAFEDPTEEYGRNRNLFLYTINGSISVKCTNNSDFVERRLHDWQVCWILVDEANPTIANMSVEGINYTNNDVINMNLKFTEPVQATKEISDIKIKATLEGTGDFNNKEVEFVCTKIGNGNNVIFTFDPREYTGTISKIKIKSFQNTDYIVDYGRNRENKNNPAMIWDYYNTAQYDINYDNTKPEVSIDSKPDDTTNKSYEKTVTVTGKELEGLYYVWTTEENIDYDLSKLYYFYQSAIDKNRIDELPNILRDLYDKYKDLDIKYIPASDFDENNQVKITLEDVTGDYYLHLCGKSMFINNTAVKYGPFRIDNKAPSISNITPAAGSTLAIKKFDFELSDYNLAIEDGELTNIQNIILYAKESPLSDLEGAKRILVYGEADPSLYDIDGTTNEYDIGLMKNNVDGKIKLTISINCEKHLGFEEGVKESGIYYIGFSAADITGNQLELEAYDKAVLFDIENAVLANIVDGNEFIDGYYILDLKDNAIQTITIETDEAYNKEGYEYKITEIDRYQGNNIEIFDDINPENPYFDNYIFGDGTNVLSFKTKENACGYYEIKTTAINTQTDEEYYARIIRLYIIDSSKTDANTLNYQQIYNDESTLKNIVYFLNNPYTNYNDVNQYFYRTGSYIGDTSSSYYNGSTRTLVFSSKEKATEYIKAYEYLDLYPVVIGDGFNIDQIIYNKAEGETETPKLNDVWIRYKAKDWDYDNQRWKFYYFNSQGELPTLDVNNLPTNLANAINEVVSRIVGYGLKDALKKENGGLDNNGAPTLQKKQIPAPDSSELNETKSGATLLNNNYEFDSELYSSAVLDARLATGYKFSYYSFTKIFYAEDGSEDFKEFTGKTLGSVINTSGKYTIKEYDSAGIRIYSVYVDKDEPTLDISYTSIDNIANEETLCVINNGDFIHAKSFSIKENGFKDAIDNCSYLLIYDITTKNEVLMHSIYAKDFENELVLEKEKIYKVLVGDRSGNIYSFKVSITEKELKEEVNPEIEIVNNDKIIVTIKDRNIATITNFTVYYNGEENDLLAELTPRGNDCVIELKEAGEYEFNISDLYGYQLVTTAKLTRANISENENIVWYAKIGSAFEEVSSVATTDNINYNIKSDKELYLKLDGEVLMPNEEDIVRPDAIYRYETTGNVTVERFINNETVYLKTSSAQSDRWTLKLYYKDYPEIYANYSRIDERGSSWLNDYEVSISASLVEYNGQINVTKDSLIKFYVVTKLPGIGGVSDDKLSDLNLGAHVRTISYSAIGGVDYDPLDEVIYLTNKDYEVIYQPVYINVKMINYALDGNTAYFNIELADVLAEGFSVNNAHNTIKVTIAAKNRFSSSSAYSTLMMNEYLTADRYNTGFDTGEITDKEGQKFWKYFNYAERVEGQGRSFNSFIDRDWAVLYVECDTNMDEKWVSLSSTFDICLYDRDSKGTQLFSGSYNKMSNSKIYFGVSVSGGNVKEESATFAPSPYAFKDTSESYSREKGYYVRLNSRQLAVSYVNGSNYFRRIYNWYNTFILIDEKAPTITGWYIDNNNYKQGQKLNIIVTFSEPVHINGNASNVKLKAILKGSDGFADKEVEFVCDGNLGLDRLVFSYDPSNELDNSGHIGNIIISGITGSNNIFDYGRNIDNANNSLGNLSNEAELKNKKMAPSDLNSDLTIKYDSSNPHFTIITGTSEAYQSEVTVDLLVEGKELSGVYYLISDSEQLDFNIAERYELLASIRDTTKPLDEKLNNFSQELKDIYDNIKDYKIGYISASELSEKDGKFSVLMKGLTGNYYLHVLAKSAFSDDKDELNTFGVFKLSNAAPEIENITTTTGSESKDITFEINDFMIKWVDDSSDVSSTISGLYNIILHVSTLPLSNVDSNETKILLYGHYAGQDIVRFEEITNELKFTRIQDSSSFKVSFPLNAEMLLDDDQEFSTFYIGISATNALYNESQIFEAENHIAFDTRSEISAQVFLGESDQPLTDDEIQNAYIIDISNGSQTIKIMHNSPDEYAYHYIIKNFKKQGDSSINPNISTYFDEYPVGGVENNNIITLKTKENSVGYYEIRTSISADDIDESDDLKYKYTNIIRLYIINGSNGPTNNYSSIYNQNGDLIINEVFSLNISSFYYRNGQQMGTSVKSLYNDSEKPLIFSDKEKAREYVTAIEYLDLYPVVFTNAELINYTNGNLKIDPTETHRPTQGDVWIRYKSAGWKFSTAQNDWMYYYYRDGDIDNIDVTKLKDLSPSLYLAIEAVVGTILSKGSMIYLTDLNDSLNSHGVPSIDGNRIPKEQTFNMTKMETGLANNKYEFDKDIYYSSVNVLETPANNATWHKFTYSSVSKIFYKKAGSDDDFVTFKGNYLSEVVSESGNYIIKEYDENGMNEYQVYVDKTAPTIIITYQDIKNNNYLNVWTNYEIDGKFLHTNNFKVVQLFDNEYNPNLDDYKDQETVDKYANITIIDITTGERNLYKFVSVNKFSTEYPDGFELDEGVYEIIVSDRSGNRFSFMVSVISEEKALKTEITVIQNDKIIVSIPNRDKATISSFIYNNRLLDKAVDFIAAATLVDGTYQITFKEAGFYGFTISDLYGYTIRPNETTGENCATLTRVKISENDQIQWYTRDDKGEYKLLDIKAIDNSGETVTYLKSNSALSLRLDSKDIYSYEFTGNVKYIRKVVDNYVYLDITSTERWSLRLYYTDFPDNFITYNRIGEATIVPAEISLTSENTNTVNIVQPDSNNNIIVYVEAITALTGPVEVTIRTKNRSAIAELGDYEAYEATVTLTTEQPKAKVVILTHPSGFATYDNGYLATRTFDVVIDRIEGNAEAGKSQIECAVAPEYEYYVVEKNGFKVFEAYLKGESSLMNSIIVPQGLYGEDSGTPYDETQKFKVNSNWVSTFLNSGVADIYVSSGFNLADTDEAVAGISMGNFRVSLNDSLSGRNLFYAALDVIGSSQSILLGSNYGTTTVNAETYDSNNSILLSEARGNALIGRYFALPKSSNGTVEFNVQEYRSTMSGGNPTQQFTIAALVLSGNPYIIAGRSASNLYGYSTLIDTTRPTIQSWYLDEHPVKIGEKMRLSVRFSEPVYINGKAPIISAKSKGTTLEFKYKGGAGTDTLFFEYDPENDVRDVVIDEVIFDGIVNQGSIVDYAYNVNKENNKAYISELPKATYKCNLDSRTPSVNMTNDIKSSPVRNTTVNLAFSKLSAGAMLYYSWTTDSNVPVDFAFKKPITTNELEGLNIECTGLNGVYYLHVNVESAYGKIETKTFGPFYFDNQAPIISNLEIEDPSKPLDKRNVSFTIEELPKGSAGSTIDKIYLYYGIHGEQTNNRLVVYSKDGSDNLFEINENGRVSFVLYGNKIGLLEESQGYYDIGFYASDTLGNTTTIVNYTFCKDVVNFDNRSSVEINVETTATPIFTAEGINLYDTNDDLSFRFRFSYQADEYNINEFYLGDTLISRDNYADYFSAVNEADGITLTIRKGLVGYIRLNLMATSGSGQSEINRDSRYFSFYISDGFNNAVTKNFEAVDNGTLLINKVYFLGTYSYYYHDGTSIKQLSYNDTSLLQAFSSKEKAKEYVRYYEILDLGVLRINTQAVADSLNSGDGSYRKASQDNSINAEVDQVWIRYKRSTWSESTSPDAWVYYYYGSTTDIDLNNLPQSLSLAIEQVVETIVAKGGYEYLTNDNEGLDKYNSPVLNVKQINTGRITAYSSLSEATFRVANTFVGDPDIYNSMITPAGFDACSLATTYQFVYSNYTKLFYAKDDGTGKIPEAQLNVLPEGTVFGELDLVEGIYWIREIDENGARDYQVYIDKTAPSVKIRYVNADDEQFTMSLDSSVNGLTYGWKSIEILEITNEIDDMAYVAVYKKNGVLYGVYRKDEIPTNGVQIPEGLYYFEILDRSGNMYKINIALTDSPLEVKVRIEDSRYIKVDCNREENQIVSYEIYLDDLLISTNYLPSASYYQSGSYRIYVRDSYGFKYDQSFELRRDLPVVTWYYNENSTYVQYDGTQNFIKIEPLGEKEYQITTNRLLTFMFDNSVGYEYEFNQKGISSQSNYSGKIRVTLTKEVDWTVVIRYERYPEVSITYRCIFDNTAPVITADASQDMIAYNDQKQVAEANLNITGDSPYIYKPTDVFFNVANSINFSIRDGQTIYSNLIKVKFADKSICTEVRVFLDDVLISESKEPTGVKDITLSRLGTYLITAKDALGNESRFTFTNEETVNFEYVVDDELKQIKKNPSTLILNDNYPIDAYGYKYAAFNYNGSATIVFLIIKGDETRYYRFRLLDSTLYEVEYSKKELKDDDGNTKLDIYGNPIYVYSESYSEALIADVYSKEPGSSFRIVDEANGFVNIYLKLDEYMNISYYVEASKDEVTVYSRLNYSDINEPYFAKTVLCGDIPTVTLVHTNPDAKTKEITPDSVDKLISLNGDFIVKNTDFKANHITEVLISYSETSEFSDYITIFSQESGYIEHHFNEDGLYSLIVINEYGYLAEYRLILSSDFRVVTKADYEDDVINQYSSKTKNIVKTNKLIELDIYSNSIRYTVTYNGIIEDEEELSDDKGICTILFDRPGLYSVLIIDGFENEVVVEFEIEEVIEIEFKHDYLTGYNEKALRYDEGYTNQRLSINKDALLADGIKEVSMIYNDKTYPIYNLLVENAKEIIDEDLVEVVGKFGDGIYTLFIRNEYGNTTTYDVHYLETSPLTLTRQIRTSTLKELIEITNGNNKVYSNFLVNLETEAALFEVKVDGATKDMPLELRFPTDGETDEGEYIYTVTYLDEYGFEYTIEVNLVRKKLDIDLEKHMTVTEIDDVKMTKNDIQIDFDTTLKCEYTLNGSERYPYESGNILTSDGLYRFYLTDKAGNIHTATIKKDTIVEYIFNYEGTERVVENGSVINKGKVKFSPVNGDSAEIKIIALNGATYTGSATTTFAEDGKWEILIEDKMHNTSYFLFYIITHSLSTFDYTTPYTYKITDLIFDSGDGIEISYLGNVIQNDYTSRMKFTESGKYVVTAKSNATATVLTFEITIDKVPPKVELVGTTNGASTTENVTIEGCQANDTIKVYKDGELIETINVTTAATKMPEIREKGEYKIEVINLAGNVTTLTFVRRYTANVATTIAIIAGLVLLSTAIFVGLIYRKRMKV